MLQNTLMTRSLSARDEKTIHNFHSLEVVDRVSETQLQVGENSNDEKTIPIYTHLEETSL